MGADGSIRLKSPPPHLLTANSGLPSEPESADHQGQDNSVSPMREIFEDQAGSCNGAAWLADLQRILCGDATDLSDNEEDQHAAVLTDPTTAAAERQAEGKSIQTLEEVCLGPVAKKATTKEGKQPKRGSNVDKKASAATKLGQSERPKKASDGGVRAQKRPVVATSGAAAREAASKLPQKSLKERMQLNGLTQQERMALASARNSLPAADSMASYPQHGKPPADDIAGDSSPSKHAAAQEADEPAPQVVSCPDSEKRLSQQPLLQRLQTRLHHTQRGGAAADANCQHSAAAGAGTHANHSAAEPGECNMTHSQLVLADRISGRAPKMEPHDQQRSSGPATAQNNCPGVGKAAVLPDAVGPCADPEVIEVPGSDEEGDAEVAALSQMPLACRLPQARHRAAASALAQRPPGSQCLHAAALAGSASALQHSPLESPGATKGAPPEGRMQEAHGVGKSAGMQAFAAQQIAAVQTTYCGGEPLRGANSPAVAQQQSRLPVAPTWMHSELPKPFVDGATAAQQSAQQPQERGAQPRRAAVGNWDLLDDLGGMDNFMAPPHDRTSCVALHTPCAAPKATPGGATLEDPSSSSSAEWGRHAPKHRNVLWSPDESPLATERPAQDTGRIHASDSTGSFRRPVARRKRALIDSCTPGA